MMAGGSGGVTMWLASIVKLEVSTIYGVGAEARFGT